MAATAAQHCALAAERSVTDGEQPILAMLISIRNRLAALKKDRGNYYRPHDIVGLYNELLGQVKVLHSVRAMEQHDNDTYKNRVDSVLDECFQLFSLFYLALGKNKEIPATYVQLVTIKVSSSKQDNIGLELYIALCTHRYLHWVLLFLLSL
ncbi:hypothetical protein IWW47_003185 [Coemansia sp. RSA 2052]|nr:hypothetical protein IWW47_003185 [Coemansia sp. RSA 2052]